MSNTAENLREKFATPLPPQLQRARDEVNRMMRGEAPNEAPPAPGGSEATGPEPATEAVPAGAEGEGMQPTPVRAPQAEPSAPVPEAAPTKPDSVNEVESLRKLLEEARQEARTWKGRHTKTVEEQKALEQRLVDLETRLRTAEEQEVPPPKEVSAEELEAYGEDLLSVAERYVMPNVLKRIEAALRPVFQRLEDLESGVSKVKAKSAKSEWDQFIDRLTERVPAWKEVDETEAFGRWLDEEDPLFGLPRRNGLVSATQNLDDVRVAKVFQAYFSQTGVKPKGTRSNGAERPAPAGTEEPAPTAQPKVQESRPSLEDFAAPGKPASPPAGAPVVPGGKKVWTMDEVNAYYVARARGTHPHSKDAAAARAMDEELAAAQREGRVR